MVGNGVGERLGVLVVASGCLVPFWWFCLDSNPITPFCTCAATDVDVGNDVIHMLAMAESRRRGKKVTKDVG